MVMSSTLCKAILVEAKILGFTLKTSYSGRFMFGTTCFGLEVDRVSDLMKIAGSHNSVVRKFFAEVSDRAAIDDMGLGKILYFPGVVWNKRVRAD